MPVVCYYFNSNYVHEEAYFCLGILCMCPIHLLNESSVAYTGPVLFYYQSFLGMLYHNENEADGIQQVLTALHKYVPYYRSDENRTYSSQGVVADQLSVERGMNALFELSNGFTPEERLEGLHLEIADWHAGNKFFKVMFFFFNSDKPLYDLPMANLC